MNGFEAPLLYHNDGSGWTASSPSLPAGLHDGSLSGVWGSSSSDVYAIGDGSDMNGNVVPLLYHNDGSGWTGFLPSLPAGWGKGYLYSVWGSSTSNVHVGGFGYDTKGEEVPLLYHIPKDYNISGNAGVAGATLSYIDGTTKTVTADGSGNYTINVPPGWSGVVTPSKAGYVFTPGSRTYTNVTSDQSNQDYTATVSFNDVPTTYWAWQFIEILVKNGVTLGCGSGNYCPLGTVNRDQMAIFLLRGIHGAVYAPPAMTGTKFGDVPLGHWAGSWIEQLALEGITAGCGGGNYCPSSPVSRDQMAVFLLRAKHGSSYVPPAATGVFQDVPTSHWAAAWIEQLAAEGITSGCSVNPKNYCPATPVLRDQMAVFLVRAFNLQP
jgi:hypothetical protein